MTSPILDFGFTRGTFALLLAGRALDEYAALTMEHVARLRALAAELRTRTGLPVVVAPGGDLSPPVEPTEGPIYTRLALGVLVAVADADSGTPLGPLSQEELRAGARRAASIPQAFWDEAAQIASLAERRPFSPAQRRASAAEAGHPTFYDGIALDPAELRGGPDALLLVSSGRLPAADLVWGVPESAPATDDGDDEDRDEPAGGDETQPRLFLGQATGQEPHRQGVRGSRVAHANYAGKGVVRVDPEAALPVAAASRAEGAYFLVPYYD